MTLMTVSSSAPALYPNEEIIHAGNYRKVLDPEATVDGEHKARGLIPRSYASHPLGHYEFAPVWGLDMPLIPRGEWPERIADQLANRARLSDVRMTGMNGSRIPSRDQNGKGYCLPPGTKIRMEDGSQKPIETVQMFDRVLSAEGNIRRVLQLHAREYNGPLINVKLWGHSHLEMTPNHSLLTKRGYVRADRLTTDDYVAIPKYAPCSSTVVQTALHIKGVKRRVKNRQGAAAFEYRIPNKSEGSASHLPDFIDLTRGVGRIFGLWLAEGHIDSGKSSSSHRVVWSFGTVGKADLVAELVELLDSEWGIQATVKCSPKNESVTSVTIQGVMWCQLFESLCGRLAGKKRVHADLLSGPREFLEGLFTGHRDADGERTVSPRLAQALFDIANVLGKRPGILKEEPQNNEWCQNRQAVWRISLNEDPSKHLPCGYDYRVHEDDKVTWRRVRKLESRDYEGMVYNIGVEVDNSYVAESIGVHNCWAHSTTSAVLIARAVMNEPYVDLSAYAVACIIKNYRDEGGWGAQSAEFIAQRGIPSSKFWPQKSMSKSNDNAATWENAALHKITARWVDMNAAQYDQKLTFDQYVTLWLSGEPGVCDFNWWGHSVCGIDVVNGNATFGTCRGESGKLLSFEDFNLVWGVDTEAGGYGTRIWNSWGDSWSEGGTGVLTGAHAIPDGGLGIRGVRPSVA